ncbi:hypothetical protein EHO59_04780 [Leptospira semungkisensis]|uniref:M48 family peptidase n=1 Tax=Leptospira semungkisensis TaxID=2484985 RepID=A0A4R9G8P5_9LEPT|nr:hypothetical protein [Leptospira semungkisensis]TGK07420.1 hypothetical protein EHO59_04780 [Leptospira semungkisensis]
MTDLDFQNRVSKKEIFARSSPFLFKLNILLLILLEYSYLFIGAAILAAASYLGIAVYENFFAHNEILSEIFFTIFGMIGAIAILSSLVPFWIILSSFRVKTSMVTGTIAKKESHPELFEFLERLGRAISGPRIREVYLTETESISFIRIFNFGIFGPSKNYLLLGIPSLTVFTPEEFEARVAYEYCLNTGSYGGRFAIWVNRVFDVLADLNRDNSLPNSKSLATILALSRARVYEANRKVSEFIQTDNSIYFWQILYRLGK